MRPIITLTTDYGTVDQYVGVVKASILSRCPDCTLIDISHNIPPQDIMAGAWVLRNSVFRFPSNTIHIAVVDPGVGSMRKPIVVRVKNQVLVGPDNGLFSLLQEEEEVEAYEILHLNLGLEEDHSNFHGRDVFGPAAAEIANGRNISELGPRLDDIVTYKWALPTYDTESIQGWVVHIDHYGNLITNIDKAVFESVVKNKKVKIYVGSAIINELSTSFSNVPEGETAAILGSSDMIEIAINKGNASSMLDVEKGAQVSIIVKD